MRSAARTAPRIAALLTCHNRRELTLACLERLARQQAHNADIDVVVLDAASSDGTATAIESRFRNAIVLRGRSDQFWNRGMHEAFEHAVRNGPYDFYLWLNDDTHLDSDALSRLHGTYERLQAAHGDAVVVVGSTRDPDTGALSYGGMRRSVSRSRLRFERVPPDDVQPLQIDTMNGNFVLIPQSVVMRVGTIDPAFFHGLGDFDYGLRANAAGCSVWMAPGTIGTCRPNKWPQGRWNRLRLVFGRRRTRFSEWYTFARRWGGRWWPILVFAPYVRHAVLALTPKEPSELAESNRG